MLDTPVSDTPRLNIPRLLLFCFTLIPSPNFCTPYLFLKINTCRWVSRHEKTLSVSGQFYIRKSVCVRVFMGRSDPDSESLQCSGIYWGWWDCSVFCELQCDNSLFLLVKVFILFVFLTCDSVFHPCPLKHFPQVCTQSWTSHCWTPGVLMTLFR